MGLVLDRYFVGIGGIAVLLKLLFCCLLFCFGFIVALTDLFCCAFYCVCLLGMFA